MAARPRLANTRDVAVPDSAVSDFTLPSLDFRAMARRAVYVGYEEDLQGVASVAAGWTSAETWLPASCV